MIGLRLNDVKGSLISRWTNPLIGLSACTVDGAGRITVPAKFRRTLIRQGFSEIGGYMVDGDDYIKLLPATLDAQTRQPRWFGVSLIRPDGVTACCIFKLGKRGRITLPNRWRQAAGITTTAYVQGTSIDIRVWSPKRFETRKPEVPSGIVDEIGAQEPAPCARSVELVCPPA